jgi:Flp pilus assembly protein TadD
VRGAAGRILPAGLAAALLAGATFLLYLPVRDHGFLSYDDPVYLTGNPLVRGGLSARSVGEAFGSLHGGNWHPLTWLSHMADVSLFGLSPGPLHLANVAWHALNAILFSLLVLVLAGRLAPAFALGLLFAAHPVHVESVAWLSQRKDLLAACFSLTALLLWARYARRPGAGRYLAAVGAAALALMAKPTAVVLPLLLLVLDWWPLGRWQGRRGGGMVALAVEKAPLLALSVLAGLVTFLAQAREGAVGTLLSLPLHGRVANALVSLVLYLRDAVWPWRLAVFYPHPGALPAWQAFLALLLLGGITWVALRRRNRWPGFLAGWLLFLAMLLPVLGLVQVGAQGRADRYLYLPLAGLLLIPLSLRRPAGGGPAALVLMAVPLVYFSLATRDYLGHWRDSAALFQRAARVTRGNWVAHLALGVEASRRGDHGAAEGHYREALAHNPDSFDAQNNLGLSLLERGRSAEALPHLLRADALRPGDPVLLDNLGSALQGTGRVEEAVAAHRRSLELDPGRSGPRVNLGAALMRAGRLAEAEGELRRVLGSDPDHAVAHYDLGLVLERLGRPGEAAAHFRRASLLRPGYREALAGLGRVAPP